MTDNERPTEGWQGEKSWNTHRAKYHYIRGTDSLCGNFMLYFGEISPGGLKASDSKEDCAACKRAVAKELAAAGEKG